MKELTRIEEILLLAIWRLQDEAYGVKIRQHVSEVLKKEFTYGNLYSALDQLAQKQFVTKTIGGPVPSRRGRSRIYYKISPQGAKALKASRELQETLWADIPKTAFS